MSNALKSAKQTQVRSPVLPKGRNHLLQVWWVDLTKEASSPLHLPHPPVKPELSAVRNARVDRLTRCLEPNYPFIQELNNRRASTRSHKQKLTAGLPGSLL